MSYGTDFSGFVEEVYGQGFVSQPEIYSDTVTAVTLTGTPSVTDTLTLEYTSSGWIFIDGERRLPIAQLNAACGLTLGVVTGTPAVGDLVEFELVEVGYSSLGL